MAGDDAGHDSQRPTLAGDPGLRTTAFADDASHPGAANGRQDAPDVEIGMLIGDRYRVKAPLGAGGMGVVYLAEHTAIGKLVAVKVLGRDFSHRAGLVERFIQEARAASSIRHENIVDITDFGHVREGVPYYVMEFLEGESLAQRLRHTGPMPWPRARAIVLQICAALQAAHDRGVIHRDMKPDNCFLVPRPDGEELVKVLDFGIAKVMTEGTSKSLTQTGVVMGTASYMSPEQAQSLELDPRTDIYSAGIVLFELLAGRVPFQANGFLGMLTKHLTEEPPSLRKLVPAANIPLELDREVLRALAKDRDMRHPSAEAFARALRAIPEDAHLRGRRRSRLVAMGVALPLLAGVAIWTLRTPPKDTTDASDPGVAAARREHRAQSKAARVAASADDAPTSVQPGDATAAAVPPSSPEPEAESEAEPESESESEATPAVEPEPEAEPEVAARPEPEPPRARPKPKTTTTREPPASTRDRLAPGDIDRALARAKPAILACGRTALPGMHVKVTFTVDPQGKVSSAAAHKPHKGLPLGRCVARAIENAPFPKALQSSEHTRSLVVR